MVSALVLQLIQCCPSLVKLAIVGTKKGIDLEPQKPQADGESAVTVSDANSYEAAAACALAFMKSFVAKYVNPSKGVFAPRLTRSVVFLLALDADALLAKKTTTTGRSSQTSLRTY